MEHHRYSQRSLDRLSNAHHDLELVMILALKKSKYDIGITETLRTIERQKELINQGKSTTMDSRHLPNKDGVSEAVDFVAYKNGKPTYEPSVLRKVAGAIFDAAFELGIHIQWGGHWESFQDMPHIQLYRG